MKSGFSSFIGGNCGTSSKSSSICGSLVGGSIGGSGSIGGGGSCAGTSRSRIDTPMPQPGRKKCDGLTTERMLPRVNLFRMENQSAPELYRHFRGHKNDITSISFHPNLPRVISGGRDGYVMCWDYENSSARVLRFEGHERGVTDVSYNRDGDLMCSASEDSTVRIWVPTIRGDSQLFKAHHSTVTSLACSPEASNEFVTASNDKCIKFWSVGHVVKKSSSAAGCISTVKIKPQHFLGSHTQNGWIHSVRYQPDSNGTVVCTAAANGSLSIIDNRGQNLVSTIKSPALSTVKYAEFNPASNSYLGACSGDGMQIYDIRTLKLVQVYIDLHTLPVQQFAFHPSGDFAFSAGEDKRVKILDLVEGRPLFTLRGPSAPLLSVASSKDGKLFATGGKDRNLLVWRPFLMPYSTEEFLQSDGIEGSGVPVLGEDSSESSAFQSARSSESSNELSGEHKPED